MIVPDGLSPMDRALPTATNTTNIITTNPPTSGR